MLLLKTCLFITREKNIRQHYKNNKLKIIAPTSNDEFELHGSFYSVSDIEDYLKHIIRRYETLPINPPIQI